MPLFNSSLPVFLKSFSDEQNCLQAVFDVKWPKGFICPYCQHDYGYRLSKPRTMQCASCRRQTSILANTIFQDSRMPLTHWFLAIYLVASDKGGVSAVRLAKELGVRRQTASKVLQKIRAAMGARDQNLTLAGYIELDEAFFGGKTPVKGTGKSPFHGKAHVLVMVESENMAAGNLVMQVIPDTKLETLKNAVALRVDNETEGQLIRADALGRHHGIRSLGHHINMSKMTHAELDAQMACLSHAISHSKRFLLGTYHHYCKNSIQSRFDEFCYRWNRRDPDRPIPSSLIRACVLHEAVPAKVLKLQFKKLTAA